MSFFCIHKLSGYLAVLVTSVLLLAPCVIKAEEKRPETRTDETEVKGQSLEDADSSELPVEEEDAALDEKESQSEKPQTPESEKEQKNEMDKKGDGSTGSETGTAKKKDGEVAQSTKEQDEKKKRGDDLPKDKEKPGSASDNGKPGTVKDQKKTEAEKPKAGRIDAEEEKVKKNPEQSEIDGKEKKENEKGKRSLFIVTYNMALPLGNSRDFINDFSFEGVGFEYRFHIRPELSIGVLFAWSTFEQKNKGTFDLDANTAITGTRVKRLGITPLCATFHYSFNREEKKAVPFAGLDMGAFYSNRSLDYAWWVEEDSAWHFGLAPEIGLRFKDLPFPVYFAAKFNYLVKSKQMKSHMYINFNLGISWAR